MSRIVGIDLGTTNSLVAYVDDKTGLPRVIPDRDGQALLPSIVSFAREGVLVGAAARRQLVRRPEATIYSVKRLMGRGYEDVKDELRYFPFRVLPSDGIEDIRKKHGAELEGDPESMQELRLAAEAAKIRLSADERTALTIPFDAFTYHREITRAELEQLIERLVANTLRSCRMALADAGLSPADINEAVLVGGSTRVPIVRRRVGELFGRTPHSQLNPDEVVALGAAVQAHILAGGITDMLLLDVTPLSLGIETLGGIVSVLIP